MDLRRVFDDGKTEAGAAHFLGMALIHSVEALEDPVQILCRNTDSFIGNSELRFTGQIAHGHEDLSALIAVLIALLQRL